VQTDSQTDRQTHWLRECTALLHRIASENRHKNPLNLGKYNLVM